jgi:hypothetical protein
MFNLLIPRNQQGIKFFLQSIFATPRELDEIAGCALCSQISVGEEAKLTFMNDCQQGAGVITTGAGGYCHRSLG